MAKTSDPCLHCGACCAHFRVAFYWREAEPKDNANPVPAHAFVELDSRYRAMKGTENKHQPACIALQGRVGQQVACQIYSNRPSPCRNFRASYSDGRPHARCDEARRAHGLLPLRPEDFFEEPERPLSNIS